MNDQIRTQISAFVDGELPDNEAELLLRRMCHDAGMRRLAAEYMALGRALRGERVVAGTGQLRDRIAAAIDDKSLQADDAAAAAASPRFLRPVVGTAIAAAVALAAILVLQQVADVPGDVVLPPETTAAAPAGYTVPDPEDAQLRRYRLRHAVSSSYFEPNSITARIATLELADGTLVEIEPQPVETAADDDDAAGDAADEPSP